MAIDSKRLAELVAQNKAKQAGTSTPYPGSAGTTTPSNSNTPFPGMTSTAMNGLSVPTTTSPPAGGSQTPIPSYLSSKPASTTPSMTSTAMNGLSVPMPGMTSGSSNNVPMPNMNAATGGSNPALGYGSGTYGSNAATNRALEANAQYIKDPANRQSEITRTLDVIKNRKAQGLDISAQTKYLNQLGYVGQINDTTGSTNMIPTPNGSFPAVTDTSNTPVPPPMNPGTFTPPPATDSPQVPVYNPAIPVMDEDAIRKYAEDQTNRKLSDLRLDADQQIQTGQTTADAQVAAAKAAYEQYIRQLQANYDQTTGTAKTDAAKQLAAAQASYDQYVANANANAQSSLGALQTQYDRQSTDINQDRGVENVQNARRLNPFSGRSDYALGMIEQERARTDRQRQEDLASSQGTINNQLSNYLTGANQTLTNAQSGINSSLADILSGANTTLGNAKTGASENLTNIQNAVGQQVADLKNQINAKYAALQNAAPDEQEALFQSIKNDERNYDLMVHGQLTQDLLTNSQLSGADFQKALQTWQANYQALQDKIQNDAAYAGIYGNAPTFQAQQQAIDNLANYGGVFNGAPTFQAQQAQIQNDAQYGGTYNGQQTVQQQQQQWDNRFNYGNAIGQFSNGQQTVQYQQLQQDKQQYGEQFAYQKARDMIADKQWQQQFDEDYRRYGLDYALQKNAQALQNSQWQQNFNQSVSEFNKNYGLQQDQNDLAWINADNKMQGNNQPPQYNGMTASQVASAVKGQIFDQDGALKQGITPDNIWQTVVGYGLPDGQDDQVMMSLGLTRQQIADLDKKYGATGG